MKIIIVILLCFILVSSANSMRNAKTKNVSQKNHHPSKQHILDQSKSFSEQEVKQVSQDKPQETEKNLVKQSETNSQPQQVQSSATKLEGPKNESTSSSDPLEMSEFESYQMRFFVMSLLSIISVVSCCLGVQYILSFVDLCFFFGIQKSKTCKIASSEIKWMKEMEIREEAIRQQQNNTQQVYTTENDQQ